MKEEEFSLDPKGEALQAARRKRRAHLDSMNVQTSMGLWSDLAMMSQDD